MKKVVIFYGSRTEFKELIPSTNCHNLTDMVMRLDTDSRNLTIEIPDRPVKKKGKPRVKNFIIGSDEYAGVREHVIINFANFMAQMNIENMYLQNPPLSISIQIEKLYPETQIVKQNYKVLSRQDLIEISKCYESKIKGQNKVCERLLEALFPLTTGNRNKPVIILFYGDTGLGKTETAQLISDVLKEKLFRKQFSMFQNNQFATYLFGGAHYEPSFAKDLLNRESNVILLDEFDKANPIFHSAFYQLFDEGIYEDQNYHLELMKSIIICTSNYKSEDDIKSKLGNAIFSRFDAVIKFDELSPKAKREIATLQYEEKYKLYSQGDQNNINKVNIRTRLIETCTFCNNAREISHLIDNTFSKILLDSLIPSE